MNTQLATRQVRMQQWSQIIHARNESGLTIKGYCEQNNLSENAYYYWLKKIRRSAIEAADGMFAELAVPAEPSVDIDSTAGVIIELDGAKIRVEDPCCRNTLAMVLEVIRDAQ